MLSKENRLQKKKDFENVFKQGKSYKEKFLILKTAKNDLNVPRFGFVVSQKVSKKATIRNKIRRRLKVILSGELKNEAIGGKDFLFIALPGLANKDFEELREIFSKVYKKSKSA
ncbi:MAG: ribonuclease P protein component [Candidatus Pacebacteria bacterium]|nr:ribonuclease P protein component [Candidatus Paceibacterota bacterium]